jgi:hypothetical protein
MAALDKENEKIKSRLKEEPKRKKRNQGPDKYGSKKIKPLQY